MNMLQCLSMGTHVNPDGAMKVRAAKLGDLGWLQVLGRFPLADPAS